MVDLEALDGHTPGPWILGKGPAFGRTVFNGPLSKNTPAQVTGADIVGGRQICEADDDCGDRPAAEVKANARLIAAAPDLIAEVRALRAERDALKAQAQRDIEAWWALGCHCGIQPDGSRTHKAICPLIGVSQLRAELAAAKARLERWNPELQQAKADLARTEAERATLWQHGLDMSRERDRAREALEKAPHAEDCHARPDVGPIYGPCHCYKAALKPPEGT